MWQQQQFGPKKVFSRFQNFCCRIVGCVELSAGVNFSTVKSLLRVPVALAMVFAPHKSGPLQNFKTNTAKFFAVLYLVHMLSLMLSSHLNGWLLRVRPSLHRSARLQNVKSNTAKLFAVLDLVHMPSLVLSSHR